MASVGPKDLAALFGITPRRVQMLARDEGMPQEARGKYDLLVCVRWYIAFLQKAVAARTPSGADHTAMVELRAEKLRLARADATMREMEMEQQRRELVRVSDVARLWEDALRRMRTRFLASLGMAAVRCVGLETVPQAHAALEPMYHESLRELVKVAEEVRAWGNGDSDGVRPRD